MIGGFYILLAVGSMMHDANNQGLAIGKELNNISPDSNATSFIDEMSVNPKLADELREFILNTSDVEGEEDFENEHFIAVGEKYLNAKEKDKELKFPSSTSTLHTCNEVIATEEVPIVRDYVVNVSAQPEVKKEFRVCMGHKYDHYKAGNLEDAKKTRDRERRKLEEDKDVRNSSIKISMYKGKKKKWYVIPNWTHYDDASSCDNYQLEIRVTQKKKWSITGEGWGDSHELQGMMSSPCYSIKGQECIDSQPRVIHGESVNRPCWRQKLSFQGKTHDKSNCREFIDKKCQVEGKELISQSDSSEIWKVRYRCFNFGDAETVKAEVNDIFTPENPEHMEEEGGFSDAVSTLAILEEMSKEGRNSITDKRQIQNFRFFSGQKDSCRKSVASNVFYDCCFKESGLAINANLAQCNSQEIALIKKREKGLCRFMGTKKIKALGVKKADEQVFVCFSSKLARVLVERAREQLGVSWGDEKNPNTSGFTYEEIQHIDFDALDLSEITDDLQSEASISNFEKQISSFGRKYEHAPTIEERIQRLKSNLEQKKQSGEEDGND